MSLTDLIAGVLAPRPRRAGVRAFVRYCRRIAAAALARKRKSGRLHGVVPAGGIDDLAVDCIADLLERDAAGRFTQLETYYEGIGWRDLDDDELEAATRRLVFGAVNDGLFRRYREVDPSLARLIRALKRAATLPDVELRRHRGALWMFVGDAGETQPLMPPEFLEAHLSSRARTLGNATEALAAVVDVLSASTLYVHAYPLTQVALAIRRAAVHLHEAFDEDGAESLLEPDYLHSLAGETLEGIRSSMRRYVDSGKVDARTFDAYLDALHARLVAEYVPPGEAGLTNYEALRRRRPELSPEVYRSEHRSVFEYLWKLVRTDFLNRVRAARKY